MGRAGTSPPQHRQIQLLRTDRVFLAREQDQGSDQSTRGTIYFWIDGEGRIKGGCLARYRCRMLQQGKAAAAKKKILLCFLVGDISPEMGEKKQSTEQKDGLERCSRLPRWYPAPEGLWGCSHLGALGSRPRLSVRQQWVPNRPPAPGSLPEPEMDPLLKEPVFWGGEGPAQTPVLCLPGSREDSPVEVCPSVCTSQWHSWEPPASAFLTNTKGKDIPSVPIYFNRAPPLLPRGCATAGGT